MPAAWSSPTIPSHKTMRAATRAPIPRDRIVQLLVLAAIAPRGFTIQQLTVILRTLQEQFGERLYEATGGGGNVKRADRRDGRVRAARRAAAPSSTC